MKGKRNEYIQCNESKQKSYIWEYLSSSDSRRSFERRKGLSPGRLYKWMTKFQIEDTKVKKSIIDQSLVDSDSASTIASLRAENARLNKENRQLQRDLEKESLLRTAADFLIDLAEQNYHIAVRQNSDAK